MPVSIRKPTGRVGAVVEGVDSPAPPHPATTGAPRRALGHPTATVCDEVNPADAGPERVAQWFGDPTTAPRDVPADRGTGEVAA